MSVYHTDLLEARDDEMSGSFRSQVLCACPAGESALQDKLLLVPMDSKKSLEDCIGKSVNSVIKSTATISCCNCTADAVKDAWEAFTLDPDSSMDIPKEDSESIEERQQINRLSSWNTLESATIFTVANERREIDPKRSRAVKFEWPPVSAVREISRYDESDIHDLFFTEEEMDQMTADRISTTVADDVELIAMDDDAERDDISPRTTTQRLPSTPTKQRRFLNYIPTPRRRSQRKKNYFVFDEEPEDSVSQIGSSIQDQEKTKRLIQSVQICVRERSIG